ncbi:3-hydroxyacyl-CoA dehydrogenase family protein [Paenibacillus nasutitermitis]|uniref:3-hydroxybutyryl-CoA dehydrogenase n=1 Tax=Paenibacillus nasutitermitis TaxID=1652958 RepID=A0A916YVZ0_9BACL|nr:3-hydroxyacyl-CoA dehydrogenase NAD-binding domain-containing protein [Paenibacillus nasutitermitis]GGD64325.1 3-hydroxybutyryl-CoA dehydrogenase [Paenibacillus nasutitermitis]
MITTITVLGAGTMGLGIARLFASHDYHVTLYDPNLPSLPESVHQSSKTFSIVLMSDFEKAVVEADLIVESAPEQLAVKREIFQRLGSLIKPQAIVASNTSTFALEELASDLTIGNRMMITHFFNPADHIPLVEIVGLPSTSPDILDEVTSVLQRCGKSPVVLRKDIPGFIANRLQAALMREACYLLEKGVADAGQIDTAVKEGLGLRWAFKGPFEIADLGGLDIWSKVTGNLFPKLANSSQAPQSILEKAASGELGVKSGRGFYEYEDSSRTSEQLAGNMQRLVSFKTNINQEG